MSISAPGMNEAEQRNATLPAGFAMTATSGIGVTTSWWRPLTLDDMLDWVCRQPAGESLAAAAPRAPRDAAIAAAEPDDARSHRSLRFHHRGSPTRRPPCAPVEEI